MYVYSSTDERVPGTQLRSVVRYAARGELIQNELTFFHLRLVATTPTWDANRQKHISGGGRLRSGAAAAAYNTSNCRGNDRYRAVSSSGVWCSIPTRHAPYLSGAFIVHPKWAQVSQVFLLAGEAAAVAVWTATHHHCLLWCGSVAAGV